VKTAAALLGEAAAYATGVTLEQARLGLIGQDDVASTMSTAMTAFLAKQGPALSSQLSTMLQPALDKAIDVVKPAVKDVLTEYGPPFAAIMGGIVALAILLGVWIATPEQRASRPRRQ
jgi:hypothetical protein